MTDGCAMSGTAPTAPKPQSCDVMEIVVRRGGT
jgi:hypothetical protein